MIDFSASRVKSLVGLFVNIILFSTSLTAQAVDYSDTTPPTFIMEEVIGLKPELNMKLYRVSIQDSSNLVELVHCDPVQKPPNCERNGRFPFRAEQKIIASNLAPACTAAQFRARDLMGFILSISSSTSGTKVNTEILVGILNTPYLDLPNGCVEWRNSSNENISGFGKIVAADEAGNYVEVPLINLMKTFNGFSQTKSSVCFIDSYSSTSLKSINLVATSFQNFSDKYKSYDKYSTHRSYSYIVERSEQLNATLLYSRFYTEKFDLQSMNSLPTCKTSNRIYGEDLKNWATDVAVTLAEFGDFIRESEYAEATAKAKAEAEAKAKAEAEAKFKAEAEAKAKAEAAKKKTAITCVKGKKVKKVTAVKPKCPKGYKKK